MPQSPFPRIVLAVAGALALRIGTAAPASVRPHPDSLPPQRSEAYTEGYSDGFRDGFEAGRRAARKDSPQFGDAALRGEDSRRTESSGPEPRASSGAACRPDGEIGRLDGSRDGSRDGRFIHGLGGEFRSEYVFPSNPFLAGDNAAARPVDLALSGHLRYAFRFRPGSVGDRIYGGAYQGVGIALYGFGNRAEVGVPAAVYLYQGARIARLAPRLSLDYEWNLGLSYGWKRYDEVSNPKNGMTGSALNALVNIDLLLDWQVRRNVHLTAGVALTHFSNGNTKFPNAGLNALGLRAGVHYDFLSRAGERPSGEVCPAFPRHVSYDLTLFGAWRRRGIEIEGKQYAVPESYPVVGISFAPMYNVGYKFRAGIALDGVYDGSTNVVVADQIVGMGEQADILIEKPGIDRQIALGISARAEFVMPHFSVGIGLGGNVLHKGGELATSYQMLTLKLAVTRSSYLHIGYSLRDFHLPNFLMLGVGYRFNNRYPQQR